MRPTAQDIMTESVITARPDMTLDELAKLLADKQISGVPVIDDRGQLVGVASEADILGAKPGRTTVASIMTRDVVAVSADESIQEIAFLLSMRRINRVPVLREGKLVGIISRADIVRAIAAKPEAVPAPSGEPTG